jgi:hypothetical protein
MEKKFQIFISSTFEDLREEREAVAKAILEIGDIPVGMEMFSAADETQWKLIKRQIEQSDYYIVLLAHRYGSTIDNISYTEREYDFALECGIPVLGFLLDDKADWPIASIDSEPETRTRLEKFKAKIKSKMVSFWASADSLTSKVLAAISKQKNLNPMPGWIRAINIPGPETVAEIARLSQDVARLSEENSVLRQSASEESSFSLIDAMSDDAECQSVILIHEKGEDIPRSLRYVYFNASGGGGSGSFGGWSGKDRLQHAGVVRQVGGGNFLSLTELGKKFAEWLIRKGRKCQFLWTPVGGWGVIEPGSRYEQWLAEAQKESDRTKRMGDLQVTSKEAKPKPATSKQKPRSAKNAKRK